MRAYKWITEKENVTIVAPNAINAELLGKRTIGPGSLKRMPGFDTTGLKYGIQPEKKTEKKVEKITSKKNEHSIETKGVETIDEERNHRISQDTA